ncbi:MAG: thioesterase family protein, partial [Alphaproteobacteria bacterium]
MFEFDEDTRTRAIAPGTWSAQLSDRWGIGMVPNGGYVLAVATNAIRAALPDLDPLTVTAHFLRPASPGEARVEVEVVKEGRRFSTASARLVQASGEVIRVLGTWGRIERTGKPLHVAGEPPALPPRESLATAWGAGSGDSGPFSEGPPMTIRDRFEVRFDPATDGFLRGERGTRAEVRAWLRFADGRPADVHSLPLVADALPPPALHLVPPGWLPT